MSSGSEELLFEAAGKDDLDSPQVQADTDLITHEDQADHGEKNNSLTYGG